jgi:ParB family chromosome partitioning protein
MAKPALGRGLGALLGEVSLLPQLAPAAMQTAAAAPSGSVAEERERVERVALERIRPSPFQPRKDFPPEALRELADSIREQGIVQPLIVRTKGDHYELIAGERRLRAAQMCGLTEAPVLVREADDAAALELALIENLQREDLNPIEEAQGYQQLIDQFQLRQEDVAAKVGKNRASVANALRLLKLPLELQAYLRNGQLTAGHAKAILALDHPDWQKLAAERIIKAGLNVRQAEDLVAAMQQRAAGGAAPKAGRGRGASPPEAHLAAIESRLRQRLGTKVSLRYRGGQGTVQIRFFSDADLERILEILNVKLD